MLTLANKLDGCAERRSKPQRVVVTTEVIAGKKVIVQRPRMPFAVFVGGCE